MAPKVLVKWDVKGEIAGTECVFGLSQVLRTTPSKELQHATSITRRIGACSRCRRHRIRCDMAESPYQPCGRCIRDSVNLSHRLCMRINILDLNLHRKGSTLNNNLELWVQRKLGLQKIKTREENTPHILFLTQDKGGGFDNALSVIVSRFEPGPEDKTGYAWEDMTGQHHTMDMPPYFISDIEAARRSVQEFIYQARSDYIETLLADSNPIARQTFQAALAYTAFSQSNLISDALYCWVATRFIEGPWRIFCGGAMIGLEPTSEPGNPFNGIIPVTPAIDTQLDDIFLRDLLIPLTKRLLKGLTDKIEEQKRENWLEIYLTMFIMMSNMGWVMQDIFAWAKRYGKKPGARGGTLTQGFIHTCKTMLAHFHFACNGSMPLSIPWSELGGSSSIKNGMTYDQIEYLRNIQQEITHQESKLAKWKEMSMYNNEMYWCYQMLCKDWQGDIPYPGEVDDFREEDFLKTWI
ncbi:hypothetical protein BGZ60DRAFT_409666 [Tricladium varicosporioides]|nr:hypothetical protein BGZ60DRAFT_409666 [Hymenoscyphus varicosporioides]